MPKPGSSPGGAVGFDLSAHPPVPSACAGAACVSHRRGESRLFWAGWGPQGRLGTALILELFSKQGRGAVQLRTQVLCSADAAAAGSAPDLGGKVTPGDEQFRGDLPHV